MSSKVVSPNIGGSLSVMVTFLVVLSCLLATSAMGDTILSSSFEGSFEGWNAVQGGAVFLSGDCKCGNNSVAIQPQKGL